MSTLTKTPLILETKRRPSIAGTRITVFSVMDSLKSGHSRDLVKQLFLISDEQLERYWTTSPRTEWKSKRSILRSCAGPKSEGRHTKEFSANAHPGRLICR